MNSYAKLRALRIYSITRIVLIAVLVLITLGGSFYILRDQEHAVIYTFGKMSAVTKPGPHFKVPFLQTRKTVPMTLRSFIIGSDEATEEWTADSSMMTADGNMLNIDFFVEYRVLDAIKYSSCAADPDSLIRDLTRSYIRDIVGVVSVDDALTTGKAEIQANILTELSKRLIEEDFGLGLHNIYIQDANPPVEVQDAFSAVESARQGKETAVNNAKKYQNEQLPKATADANDIMQRAAAQKETRINEARGQTERFTRLYNEYQTFPLVTRQRLLLETLEEVLPGRKIIIVDDNGDTQQMLPLDSFAGTNQLRGADNNASE